MNYLKSIAAILLLFFIYIFIVLIQAFFGWFIFSDYIKEFMLYPEYNFRFFWFLTVFILWITLTAKFITKDYK